MLCISTLEADFSPKQTYLGVGNSKRERSLYILLLINYFVTTPF